MRIVFEKVLVANRGEIALRVVRACRELGLKTVGVFSDADRNLLHLRYVDQKVSLGGDSPGQTYLDVEKIIQACRLTRAEAVHPGYGFLSENVVFAERLAEEGITFIGPGVDVLKTMKNKHTAKQKLADAGVPVVPGSLEPVVDCDHARLVSEETGFPLLIKASLGGGGRGIRVVRDEQELKNAFTSACREASLAFGSGEVYIEKLMERARHVEVQILADTKGSIIHLGERECSLQRRRQKILEESPSPGISAELREKILSAAIQAARALGYTSCGTFEFLVSEEGDFYFMELNARVQVEHPVTEMVTGVDVVREQIRLAGGGSLCLAQKDVSFKGHALEMRINAENPSRNFIPTPGMVKLFDIPRGPGIRVDSHCYSGYQIPSFYDSLIAKLVVWDVDRPFAVRRAMEALQSFTVEGVPTTIPFHLKIMQNEDFSRGLFHTRFLEEEVSG